jgi:hypothetical protein
MKSDIEVLYDFLEVLEAQHITYLVVGSIASSSYGFSRATGDIDILASISAEHIAMLVSALKDEFYIDNKMIRRAIATGKPFNVIHFDSVFKLDIYVASKKEFDQQQLSRGKRVALLETSERTINLASAEDTILAKLVWYRKGSEISGRQLSDVKGIIKVQGKKLDFDYMKEWADKLNIGDLLEKVLEESK